MNSRGRRSKRDTSPIVIGKVPGLSIDCLIYRAYDSETGQTVFRWRLARRNRTGDGHLQTFRLDGASGVLDVIVAIKYLCEKFTLVPECTCRVGLAELALRLEKLIAEMKDVNLDDGVPDFGEEANELSAAFSPN